MREHWARALALLTGVLVVLLTIAFATVRNQSGAPASTPASSAARGPAIDPALLTAGRAAYDAAGCARCHSIAGQGSPRSALDGIGTRRDREDLRHWIVADESVHDELSPRAIDAKERYANLPVEQLDALVAYLVSLDE